MTQSPEYPDLLWMPPKSWTDANRKSVQFIVIHTTEGSARGTSAEDGAAYDQRRTDGTSTHYFHDNNSTVQCVRTADQAHAARAQGNRRGIQHELCTVAGTANWADPYHQAMLKRAAKQAARDARKWNIPVLHLTVAGVAGGTHGFCGHWDITRAFPQDGGTHTDPGANFPWTQFLNLVRAELTTPAPAAEDDHVDANDAKILLTTDGIIATPSNASDVGKNPKRTAAESLTNIEYHVRALESAVTAQGTVLMQLATRDVVDEAALATALAPLIAALLPPGVEVTPGVIVEALRQLAGSA